MSPVAKWPAYGLLMVDGWSCCGHPSRSPLPRLVLLGQLAEVHRACARSVQELLAVKKGDATTAARLQDLCGGPGSPQNAPHARHRMEGQMASIRPQHNRHVASARHCPGLNRLPRATSPCSGRGSFDFHVHPRPIHWPTAGVGPAVASRADEERSGGCGWPRCRARPGPLQTCLAGATRAGGPPQPDFLPYTGPAAAEAVPFGSDAADGHEDTRARRWR